MSRQSETTTYADHAAARFAWLGLAFPLVLAVMLLVVSTTHASPVGPSIVPLAFEEEWETEAEEEEESGEEACAEAEMEFEEGERDEIEVEEICAEEEDEDRRSGVASGSTAPEECLLRSVRARAVASPEGDKLKLTVGYTTYEPVGATVEVRKGSDRIASSHRQLGRSGVLRIVKGLGKGPTPKRVVVRIWASGSPRYCGKFQTQKIRVR